MFDLRLGDCIETLRAMPDNSVDSIVTDPPYGLSDHKPADVTACLQAWLAGEPYMARKKGFMGKTWDSWVPGPEVWRECLRVLKPGGHLLAFAGTRTMDLMSMAVRLAGFELRDSIGYAHDGGGAPVMAWCYGSGFPKSTDVSKQIDKRAGAEREVVGVAADFARDGSARKTDGSHIEPHESQGGHGYGDRWSAPVTAPAPATEAARQWQGWGSALKPAWEPIIIARKPLIGTIAENVLAHGTGALNINGCRIEHVTVGDGNLALNPHLRIHINGGNGGNVIAHESARRIVTPNQLGRWPANLILDGSDEVVGLFPAQAGAAAPVRKRNGDKFRNSYGTFAGNIDEAGSTFQGDKGSAARFFQQVKHDAEDVATAQRLFYCAKASKRDRSEGCEHVVTIRGGVERAGNIHETVKPTDLMRYLCRLVTPPGGVVLDPFMGSGSTGKAAMLEGFRFIGCELSPEYAEIAKARIEQAHKQAQPA